MAGDWEESALTERNYTFGLVGEEQLDGRNCYVLSIEPRRESKDLIRGKSVGGFEERTDPSANGRESRRRTHRGG